MKTTITMIAAALVLQTGAFAQPGHSRNNGYGNNKDVVVQGKRGEPGYGRGTYYFSVRDRDNQLTAINRHYSRQIEAVHRKVFTGRGKKERMINALERQRREEVRLVMAKFNDRDNSFHRDGYRNKDRYGKDRY